MELTLTGSIPLQKIEVGSFLCSLIDILAIVLSSLLKRLLNISLAR